MTVAMAVRARHGDSHCGDAIQYWKFGSKTVLCVIDGLGHGSKAELAASKAIKYVGSHLGASLTALFSGCDRALYETRGAAMGVARIDAMTGALEYAAVGNTRGLVVGPSTRRFLISTPGIIGGGYRHLCAETLSLRGGERVFLYTDGFPRSIDTAEFSRRLYEGEPNALASGLLDGLATEADDSAMLIYLHGAAR